MQLKRLRFIQVDLYICTSIFCLYFAAFASLYSPTANKVGLYVAIPMAVLLCTLINRGFKTNIYEKILYALLLWDCIAYFWAGDKELAANEVHQVLGAAMMVYVVSILSRYPNYQKYIYFTYIILYLSAWNYAIHHIFTMMVDDSDRLNDEMLNANTMAYYTFYVTFLSFMLYQITKKRWAKRLWAISFWLMLPVSFGVSLLTSSRQVIIIQVPLYGMLLYERYIRGVQIKKKIQFSIAAVLVIVALSGQILNIYENSFLKQRAEKDVTEDSRMMLVYDATKVALQNMPLGVGSGNYQGVSCFRQISHNSYLEAFVNLGFIGLALYIALMAVFTLRQWRRYKTHHNKMYFYFFTFGLIYSFYGVFFVFYNAIWLISFFMLVAAHSETYYSEQHKELNKELNKNSREELSNHCGTQEQMLENEKNSFS